MRSLLLLAFIVLILWVLRTYLSSLDERVRIEAFDGRSYLVRDLPHKHETANALARLNGKFTRVIDAAYAAAQSDPELRAAMARLRKRYSPDNLSEAIVEPTLTSYTVGKGEEVALCLRSRDGREQLYDDNLMMTVMCHEAAHIASISLDHTPEFMKNFRFLLGVAQQINLYNPSKVPVNYCGLTLNNH